MLTVEDYAALNDARGLRRRFGQPRPWLWYAIGVVNVVILLATTIGQGFGWSSLIPAALAIYAFAAPSLYWIILRRNFRNQGLGNGPVALEVTDSGIVSEQNRIRSAVSFDAIVGVDERPEQILIWLNKVQALIVPKRALDGSVEAFLASIERHRANGAPR